MNFGRYEGLWKADPGSESFGYEYLFAFDSKNFEDMGTHNGDETVRRVKGYIEWILTKAPKSSHCKDRIDEEAAEMVCGTFSLSTKKLYLAGYMVREMQDYLIGSDVYKIYLQSSQPVAKSKTHHLNWSGHMELKRVANREEILQIFTDYYDDENIGEIMVSFFHDFTIPPYQRKTILRTVQSEEQWIQDLVNETYAQEWSLQVVVLNFDHTLIIPVSEETTISQIRKEVMERTDYTLEEIELVCQDKDAASGAEFNETIRPREDDETIMSLFNSEDNMQLALFIKEKDAITGEWVSTFEKIANRSN